MATHDQANVLTGMLKVNFSDSIIETAVTRSYIYDLFEEQPAEMGPEGRYRELSDRIGNPEGSGARDEQSFLPVPGTAAWLNPRIRMKRNYMTIQTTSAGIENAVKGKAAFGNFAESVIVPALDSFKDDLDRQCIGYGYGILCRIDGSPSTTVPIDAPYGIASDVKGWLPGLRRGMRIVAGPNADGTGLRANGASRLILSVDPDANAGGGQLTLDSAAPSDWADNDYLFRGDDLGNNAPVNGSEVEMSGLLGMIDNGTILGTFQNISRTTYPEYNSRVIDASAAPYSGLAIDVLFLRLADDAWIYGNGNVTTFLTSPEVSRNAYNQQRSLGGFGASMPAGGNLTAGRKGMAYALDSSRTVELRAFPRMPVGRVFALDKSTLKTYVQVKGEWDERSGNMWKQVQFGQGVKDEFWAYYKTVRENACLTPRKNAVATGVSETSVG